MSVSAAETVLEIVALSFTGYAILLKIMSESPASYPDRAIRRVAGAAALMLLSGISVVVYLATSYTAYSLAAAYVLVSASFLSAMAGLRPMMRAEQAEQEDQEDLVNDTD